MQKSRLPLFAAAILSMTALLASSSQVHAQRGYVYRGHPGGFYRPYGYYPHGYYRPYPFIGVGIGIGLYAPYYGSYAYPIAPGYLYEPYPVVVGSAPLAPPAPSAVAQAPTEKPAPDGAAHLQLLVPEHADVVIDGNKISQSGKVREIVSPTLQPATRYTYRISVRYSDGKGQPVDDTREIRFQANDWFTIDFTRPAPPPAAAAPPAPYTLQLVPSPAK